MKLYDDFTEPLMTEVLTDMAQRFFGSRRQLEDMVEMFMSFAETLRKMDEELGAKAGFLNYLLLNETSASEFYKSIRVNTPDILLEGKFSDCAVSKEIPLAFTAKGEFVKFVSEAYDVLQKSCYEYNNGQYHDITEEEAEEISVNYKLIVNMCELLNSEIYKLNKEMSPVSVLQCFKQFSPETIEKESVTGAVFHGGIANNLDKKLAYSPIDFDSLKLRKYPELPKQDDVASEIKRFCKKIYSEHKKEVNKRIAELKEKIHGKWKE